MNGAQTSGAARSTSAFAYPPNASPAAPALRILLSAFACAPGLGSEEGVGWGVARALAQRHRVHVLTTPRYRAAIEQHLVENPCPNLTFSYFDFSPFVRRCVVTSALWQIYYHAWQGQIGAWAQPVAEMFEPDIVHHITYGRYWTPTTLWQLGRPFVWGPLGGGDHCPRAFLSCLTIGERVGAGVRRFAQFLARCDPNLRRTARACDVALASTAGTGDQLWRLGCERVEVMLQMAIDGEELRGSAPRPSRQLTFCTAGRLLGWKAQNLAICAFAAAALPNSRLLVIGEGPNKQRLKKLARSLGVEKSVQLTGALSRRETIQAMRGSIALLHPSLHDQAPSVVFEAMGVGTPVIALALGGLASQITSADGFLIHASTPEKVVEEMAEAMSRLASDSALRQRLSEAASHRIRTEFTWKKRAEELSALYYGLLALPAGSTSTDGLRVHRTRQRAAFNPAINVLGQYN